jgi:large repetitive protein
MSSMRIPERARLGVAALVLEVGTVTGCVGRAEPGVSITAVTPASAYSDAKVSVVIEGGPFRPVYDIDTGGATEMTELGAFTAFLGATSGMSGPVPADSLTWLDSSRLAAVLPAGITAGAYDVEVRDPRGTLALSPGGFTSLGPDDSKPIVTIDEPVGRAIVNAGAEVPVAFRADDGQGTLASMDVIVASSDFNVSGSCEVPPGAAQATCRFVFVVPQPTQTAQPLTVTVTARDSANNEAQAETTLAIGVAPVVGTVAPLEGPAVGGTRLSVMGDNFITGTKVLVGGLPLQPGGGVVTSSTLIEGTTPAHDPGPATVTVRTGSVSVDAAGIFVFVGRPEVLAITPTAGPLAGCTPITIAGKSFRENPLTRVWFGSDTSSGVPLQCPTYVSPNRIEGFVPPGTGAVSVFAGDPVSGVGELALAYTYLDVDTSTPDAATPDADAALTCPCDGGAP